jgi:transposase
MNDHQTNAEKQRTRRTFDETYKRNAVQLTFQGGRTIERIAEELGICSSLLRAWRRQYAPTPQGASSVKGGMTPEQKDEEIIRLRAENARLREREIILKKSLGILSEAPERGMPGSRR